MRKRARLRSALPPALGCAAVLALTAGCATASASGAAQATAHAKNGPVLKVDAHSIPGLGTVLVTAQGYALYMFQPDNDRGVSCTGACAGTWPPLMLPAGGVVTAGPGVQQTLLGSDPDPTGGRVATYNGWPLYTYTADIQPDQATGQNLDLNGGEWYVLKPSGKPLVPAP
jgi:predicted lipoprotein with Yx(FWY)xxD motif